MKVFIILAVFFLATNTLVTSVEQKRCVKYDDLPENQTIALANRMWDEVESDAKCMLKCGFEEANFFNNDGAIDVTKVVNHYSFKYEGKNLTEIANDCKNVDDDDKCESAFKMYKCAMEAIPIPK